MTVINLINNTRYSQYTKYDHITVRAEVKDEDLVIIFYAFNFLYLTLKNNIFLIEILSLSKCYIIRKKFGKKYEVSNFINKVKKYDVLIKND